MRALRRFESRAKGITREIAKAIKRRRRWVPAITGCIISTLWGCLLGCTSGSSPVTTKPFQFKPSEVEEVTLSKWDGETQDFWTTRLTRTGKKKWEIAAFSQERELSDRLADEKFVDHLLDTFSTLVLNSPAPSGNLETFRLKPPQYYVKWKTRDRAFEFKLGLKKNDPGNAYLTTPPDSPVWLVQGAAPRMFSLIDSFDSLRRKNWSLLSVDAVDEVEIRGPGLKTLYAQRDGPVWADHSHHPLALAGAGAFKTDDFLKQITGAQAQKILDQPIEIKEWKKKILNSPHLIIQLRGHNVAESFFYLKRIDQQVYGWSPSRADAVFLFDPSLTKRLKDCLPTQSPSF